MNLNLSQLQNLSKEEIVKRIDSLATQAWGDKLQEKSSSEGCRKYKQETKTIDFYYNDVGSDLLFKCRTNTQKLNDRKHHTNEVITCKVCNANAIENLLHFLLKCPEYVCPFEERL